MILKTDMNQMTAKEVAPGVKGRFAHSDRMTMAWWEIDEGAVLPEHSHEHEQVVNVIEGTLEIRSGGSTWTLGPGSVLVLRGGETHEARGITFCRVIDAFCPARDDYR